ncbi:MAG TPA: hypothetical protein VFP87_15530 [Chitinophagaceae bacterium]|nr:hypothetical protein [Chitinophagaceae bacterium]
MKNTIWLTVFLILINHCKLNGQDTLTAEKVIDRFIGASGGEKRINQIKTIKFEAITVFNGDTTKTFVVKAPGKCSYVLSFPNGDEAETVYNNGKVTVKYNGVLRDDIPPGLLDFVETQRYFLTDMSYQKLGYKMKLLPGEDINGKECHKVELESPRELKTIKYYDKRTGLLVKVVYHDDVVSYFSGYKSFKGFIVSTRETSDATNGATMESYVLKVSIDEDVDPSIFE